MNTDYMRGYVDGGKETKDATIERCAQVAKRHADYWNGQARKDPTGRTCAESLADECESIFEALRALKDS